MKKNILKKMVLAATTLGVCVGSPSDAQENTNSDQQKIDMLYRKLHSIKDITTYPMPDSLVNVQNRYIELNNFFTTQEEALDSLQKANLDLYLRAYDKYTVRIGKNFQLTKYFKPWELDIIKQMLPKSKDITLYDYVQQNAYARIMSNTASLADLLEWYYDIDFDVVNQKFETKFSLNDPCDENINYSLLSPIAFVNENINADVNKELKLLLNCWSSNDNDNELPNFRIPEMQAIKQKYLKNDKKINQFMDQYNKMYSYEQRLQKFVNQEYKNLTDSLNVLIKKQTQYSK